MVEMRQIVGSVVGGGLVAENKRVRWRQRRRVQKSKMGIGENIVIIFTFAGSEGENRMGLCEMGVINIMKWGLSKLVL